MGSPSPDNRPQECSRCGCSVFKRMHEVEIGVYRYQCQVCLAKCDVRFATRSELSAENVGCVNEDCNRSALLNTITSDTLPAVCSLMCKESVQGRNNAS